VARITFINEREEIMGDNQIFGKDRELAEFLDKHKMTAQIMALRTGLHVATIEGVLEGVAPMRHDIQHAMLVISESDRRDASC
jgi:hypothetical protein